MSIDDGPVPKAPCAVASRADLDRLIPLLRSLSYDVVGPTLRSHAVVYDRIESLEDLPDGWTDQQEAGRYRLERRTDRALFGYATSPDSWKRFLLPPVEPIFDAVRDGAALELSEPASAPRYAFLGVRACDLKAIGILDRVLLGGARIDPGYAARRAGLFIAAVQCTAAATTCFCASMGSGPRSTDGFDIAITELTNGEHRFLIEAATQAGRSVLAALGGRVARTSDLEEAEHAIAAARERQTRKIETTGLKEDIERGLESPHWQSVAARCLNCGNCTLVCPTCFCFSVCDSSDPGRGSAGRTRLWDSCHTQAFSYIHGGSIRPSPAARYRQWLSHKLSYWWEQFGSSGCVGCGRCITWCPAAIDITEEAAAVRGSGASASRTVAREHALTETPSGRTS